MYSVPAFPYKPPFPAWDLPLPSAYTGVYIPGRWVCLPLHGNYLGQASTCSTRRAEGRTCLPHPLPSVVCVASGWSNFQNCTLPAYGSATWSSLTCSILRLAYITQPAMTRTCRAWVTPCTYKVKLPAVPAGTTANMPVCILCHFTLLPLPAQKSFATFTATSPPYPSTFCRREKAKTPAGTSLPAATCTFEKQVKPAASCKSLPASVARSACWRHAACDIAASAGRGPCWRLRLARRAARQRAALVARNTAPLPPPWLL